MGGGARGARRRHGRTRVGRSRGGGRGRGGRGRRGVGGARSERGAHRAHGGARGQRVPEPAQSVLQRGQHERAGVLLREHGLGRGAHRRGRAGCGRALRASRAARPQPVQALRRREAEDRVRERVGPRPARARAGRAGLQPGCALCSHARGRHRAVEGRGAHRRRGRTSAGLPHGRGRQVRAFGGGARRVGEERRAAERAFGRSAACGGLALGAPRELRRRVGSCVCATSAPCARAPVVRARAPAPCVRAWPFGRARSSDGCGGGGRRRAEGGRGERGCDSGPRGALAALRLRAEREGGRRRGGAFVSPRSGRGRARRQRRGQVDVRALRVRVGARIARGRWPWAGASARTRGAGGSATWSCRM